MQIEKNKWVEDILGSAEGIARADAPDMSEHILARVGGRQVVMSTPSKAIWRIAASIILLIGLNVLTIYIYSSGPHQEEHMQNPGAIFGDGKGGGQTPNPGAVFFGN